MAWPLREFTSSQTEYQLATSPQTKPTYLGCKSPCRLLPSAWTITIHCYYLWWILIAVIRVEGEVVKVCSPCQRLYITVAVVMHTAACSDIDSWNLSLTAVRHTTYWRPQRLKTLACQRWEQTTIYLLMPVLVLGSSTEIWRTSSMTNCTGWTFHNASPSSCAWRCISACTAWHRSTSLSFVCQTRTSLVAANSALQAEDFYTFLINICQTMADAHFCTPALTPGTYLLKMCGNRH